MAAPSPSFTSAGTSISPVAPSTTTAATTITTTTTPSASASASASVTPSIFVSPTTAPAPPETEAKKTFQFPRDYHFPPFFTRQPNQSTRRSQQTKWAALILSYCSYHRIYKLALSSPAAEALFHNKRIDKRLSLADAREVLEFMRRDGRAEFVVGGSNNNNSKKPSGDSGGGGGEDYGDLSGSGDVVWIFWKTPEEWAALIEAWVDDTAQKGTVLTLYELSEGEDTIGTEFHGLDLELLQKALQVLVKRSKAQIFGQDDQLGVKFF